jgi:hypothetical protein
MCPHYNSSNADREDPVVVRKILLDGMRLDPAKIVSAIGALVVGTPVDLDVSGSGEHTEDGSGRASKVQCCPCLRVLHSVLLR